MKGISLKSLKAELDELKNSMSGASTQPEESGDLQVRIKGLESIVTALAEHKAFELQKVGRAILGHVTDKEVDDVQKTIVEFAKAAAADREAKANANR